jgi:hypothetical protein
MSNSKITFVEHFPWGRSGEQGHILDPPFPFHRICLVAYKHLPFLLLPFPCPSSNNTTLEPGSSLHSLRTMGTNSQSDMRLEIAPEQRISSEKVDLDRNLILDRHGFPLLPQPTSHKDDPLVS